jgi:hypothetical protein
LKCLTLKYAHANNPEIVQKQKNKIGKIGSGGSVSLVSPTMFVVATWVAAICGGVGIAAAFVSAIVGYQLSEKAINESNVKIAEANAHQKQAELEILQLRFPRSLDIGKFEAAVKKMPVPSSYEVLYDANAPDASSLATFIWGILFNARWPTQQTTGATPLKSPPPNILPYANMPWTQAAGGGPWGLSVVTNEKPELADENSLGAKLIRALLECVKGPPSMATLGYQTSYPVPPGGIRIIVGPKTP